MRFWIQCTRFETGQPIHINIALVGSMSRDGERTVLTYVGDGQTHRRDRDAGADPRTSSRPDGQGVTCMVRPAAVIASAAKQSIYPLRAAWIASLRSQ